MLSRMKFWQFLAQHDRMADTGKFLKIFTELPGRGCDRLGTLKGPTSRPPRSSSPMEVTNAAHGARGGQNPPKSHGARSVSEKAVSAMTLPTPEPLAVLPTSGDGNLYSFRLIVKIRSGGPSGKGKSVLNHRKTVPATMTPR